MYTPRKQAPKVFEDGILVTMPTTVLRSPSDLYEAWREITDLPRFIDELESVERLDARRSRWTVKGPGGPVTWDAEITADTPGQMIAWRSIDGGEIKTAGTVTFTPLGGDRGTRVDVTLEYVAPMGKLGQAAAVVTGTDPKLLIRRALHRFRQVMETGEVAVVRGQPVGAGRDDGPDGDKQRRTDADLRDVANMHMEQTS